MMDLQTPRTWDDETLDAAVSSRSIYQWRDAGTTMPTLSVWAQAVLDEAARRAEIRLARLVEGMSRDAILQNHGPEWYEPRQLPDTDEASAEREWLRRAEEGYLV